LVSAGFGLLLKGGARRAEVCFFVFVSYF